MDRAALSARIDRHLAVLVDEIGARPSGSPANRRATAYLRVTLEAAGLTVVERPFHARWWEPGAAEVTIDGETVSLPPSPFSRPCDVRGPVRRLATAIDLERATPAPGAIVAIDGELTAEPYFPKAFPFLDLPEQRARLERLEALRPAAVLAVVEPGGAMAVLEDGDLAFPYLAVPPAVGARLVEGAEVDVRIGGAVRNGSGVNVGAHRGRLDGRVVVSAHIDSKVTTPGALDNAGGVAALLALAEAGLPDAPPVELVFFNGEDHYAAPGEVAWLASVDLAEVRHVANIDGAGARGLRSAACGLAFPPELEARLEGLVGARPGWLVGPLWYESDHAVFAMRGIPSLAITSDGVHELFAGIVHSERDDRSVVDPAVLADVAVFVGDWLRDLG